MPAQRTDRVPIQIQRTNAALTVVQREREHRSQAFGSRRRRKEWKAIVDQ